MKKTLFIVSFKIILLNLFLNPSRSFASEIQKKQKKNLTCFLLGPRCIGKTSFMDTLKDNEFTYETSGTLGLAFHFLETKGHSKEFSNIMLMESSLDFLPRVDSLIIAYDISNFEHSLPAALDLYYEHIKRTGTKNKKQTILLGFKADKAENLHETKEAIDKALKKNKLNFTHLVFSNKDRTNLSQIKNKIVRTLLRPIEKS